MKSRLIKILFLAALLSAPGHSPQSAAQESGGAVSGRVISAEDGKPVEFAVISLLPSKIYTTTDVEGNYKIENIPAGEVTLEVSFFGMTTETRRLEVTPGKDYVLDFILSAVSFRMQEVTVTATRDEAGKATASVISRQAMDHLQASSLSDVMSLLPGVAVSNSSISDVQTLNVRGAGFGTDASEMNSLGTAVIVDGAPLSNNANLQTLSPVYGPGSLSTANNGTSGAGSPATGVDIRNISTDNIESVEVVRGIASVQYGDMTSGAVIVKSRAGASPYIIRMRTNPNIWQLSASKGFQTARAGSFNFSVDYAYSNEKLTAAYENYQRFNAKLLWSKNFGALSTNTSLELNYSRDSQGDNPDLEELNVITGAANIGGRLSTNGHLNISSAGWLKSIDWNLSASYTDKHSFREQDQNNAMSLYTTSKYNSIVSNVPGGKIYDTYGNLLTEFASGDEDAVATVTPYTYFSRYDIYGKELNAYGKVVANFYSQLSDYIDNGIVAGVDFKTDGNLGEGLVNAAGLYPANPSMRPRKYSDIPFINQFGIFAEDNFVWDIAGHKLDVAAGARFDLVNGKSVWEPRLNASFEVIPDVLSVRGGWGINAKAPTAVYLYPDRYYYDAVLFSNMNSGLASDEELVLAQTWSFDTENPDLEIATNRKAEVGFDLKLAGRYKLSVTAYDEFMDNGYMFGRDLDCWRLLTFTQYRQVSENGGGYPVLEPGNTYNTFVSYYKPLNNNVNRSRGVEFELDLGRFDAIRTSFYLNGAYAESRSSNKGNSFSARAGAGSSLEYNIGIYEPYLQTDCWQNLLTTFRAVHNIPGIGFVISLTAQVNWFEKWWTEYGNDEMFVAYISNEDGKVYDFDPAWRDDPEFSYMFPPLSEYRKAVEMTRPFLLLNLNISKEIGDWLTASFYVNNLLNNRPLYESVRNPGSYSELGVPIFFGFEMKITI